MTPRYRILPIPLGSGGGPSGNYATNISVTMDQNYVLSVQLIDQNGNALGTEQTVDLPLESVVVNGRYDDQTQSLILVLDNGNEITIPVAGLISGLQAEITTQNPLSADLITDGTNNKVFTADDKSKLDNIESNIYTSEEEYDALLTKEDADYQLRNKIDYEKDVTNKPVEGIYASKNITEKKLDELELGVGGIQRHVFLTQQEYNALQNKEEGVIYIIEGQTIEMVVNFTDQTTATYNVVID